MLDALKAVFAKSVRYVLVPLESCNDLDQSPLFDDFGFKIVNGEFNDVVFRLRNLVNLPGNATEHTLAMTYDIKIEGVPVGYQHTSTQLMDVNEDLNHKFMIIVKACVEDFVKAAYKNYELELKYNETN